MKMWGFPGGNVVEVLALAVLVKVTQCNTKLEDGCHKTHQVTIYYIIYIHIWSYMCFIQGQWQFEEIYEYKPWQGKKTVCPLQRPLAIDSTPAWLSMSNLRVVAASAGHGPEAERCHFCELIKLSKKKGTFQDLRKLTATCILTPAHQCYSTLCLFFHRNSAHSSHLPTSSQVRGSESSPVSIPHSSSEWQAASGQFADILRTFPLLSSCSLPLSMLFACFGIQTQVVSIPCVQQVKIIMEKHLTSSCFGFQHRH